MSTSNYRYNIISMEKKGNRSGRRVMSFLLPDLLPYGIQPQSLLGRLRYIRSVAISTVML